MGNYFFWIPHCTEDIQFKHGELGQTYAKEGLLYLINKTKHEDEYKEFLNRLGQRIVQVVEQYPLPKLEHLMDIRKVKNAFDEKAAKSSISGSVQNQHNASGPRYAHFVYVAGRANELKRVKPDVNAYGDEWAMDWKPFWPPVDERVIMITQQVSTEAKIVHQELPLNDTLITDIRNARENNNLVIIIVDPWTLRLPNSLYSRVMQQYDESHFFNCVLLMTFNVEDSETVNKYSELKQNVKAIFFAKMTDQPSSFRSEIQSLEELQNELFKALQNAKQKIIDFTTNNIRKAKGEGATTQPIIDMME